jgi:hypothetical protein
MPTQGDQLDRPTSATLTCRVTDEQHQAVVAWARESGRSVSEFVRDAVFSETHASAAALDQARDGGVQAERAVAEIGLLACEAQLDQALQNGALWRQRAERLERDLRITSMGLLLAVIRVLESDSHARAELARLWACLEPSDRERMLPALATAIAERLDSLCEATSIRSSAARPRQARRSTPLADVPGHRDGDRRDGSRQFRDGEQVRT